MNCQTRARAPGARDAWRKFTEIYGNPRARAARVSYFDFLPPRGTVQQQRSSTKFSISLHTTAVVSYFDYCKQTASGTAVTPPHPPRRLARRQARVFGSPLRLPPRSSLLTLRRPTECGHRPKPTPAQVRRTQGAPRPTVRLGSRQLAAGFISSSVLFHHAAPHAILKLT